MTILHLKRRQRVVEGCPMPEPQPFKPIRYGPCPLKPRGTPITANPPPGDLHAIMFAQSKLTKAGKRADAPDIETARRILADPSMPASAQPPARDTPPRAAREAGTYSTPEEWDAYYEGRAPKPKHPPF